MNNRHKRPALLGGLLLTLTLGVPAIGAEREKDNPGARQQAMDEWYNEAYSERGKTKRRDQKRLWSNKYERFMHEAAKRERKRNRALLPLSGTSAAMIDPQAEIAAESDGTWTNIGPTKANYATNGGTINVIDSGRVRSIVTDPGNANTIYVAFAGGGVWKSTDGGAFWNAKTETMGSLSTGSLEMDPGNSSLLYLGLGDPFNGTGIGIAKSTDGADTWSDPVLLGDSSVIPDIQIAPGNTNIVLVATNKGLYRSTDAGVSYSKVGIATGQAVDPYVWSIAWGGGSTFVLSLEANHDAASGTKGGQVWRSTDNGATWTQSTGLTDAAGIDRITIAAAPSNRNTMYAMAGKTGGGSTDLANLFKSTDNGATWTGIGKSGTSYKSYTNTNSESANLGTLLGGQGWYNHAIVVDPANANIAYFGGQLLLAKTSDGGSTYKQASNWLAQYSLPYVHADFHTAHIASNGTLYIGTDGGIFRSSDSAATFTDSLNEGIASHLIYQVGSSTHNRDKVILGLQDNGTRVREGATSVFNQEIGGDGFGCDVNQSNSNLMLGSLYYSRIYKSTNGGLDFSSACSGITECNNSSTAPFLTRISRWAGDATGNTLYTYSNTKVYKTTNYAGSWTALGVSGLPTTSLYLRGVTAAPSNGSVVGVVANSGRVFLTSNGGSSWAAPAATLPNHGSSLSWIAFDPTTSNTVYVASVAPDATKTHLWRSTNFGASWTAIDTAASGFPNGIPVNSIVVDPVANATLYAATHLGVYRSTDSGTSWTRYGVGMPLVNVTDMYVAGNGSLIRAATFGRSAWELSTPVGNQNPAANYNFTTSGLTASFTDTSTDSDGSIASRSWDFGDGTTSTATNPGKTYSAAGTYNVALTVTDNQGATNTVTKAVTVTATPPPNVLTKGVAVTGLTATTGNSVNYTMDVPAGATNLTFTASGGTGDADMYVKFGSAPTDSVYDCRPYKSGNAETCTFTAPSAGTYHVRLKAYSTFSGVSLVGDYSLVGPRQTYSNTTDVTIGDNTTVESAITVSGRSGNAPSDTAVAVNIVHTYIGDLKVDLVAPDGSVYTLHNHTGSSTDNINQTYTVNLSGEALNGTWKLRVNDNAGGDVGYINSWSVTF